MGLRHLALFAIFPIIVVQIFRRPHFGVYVFCAMTLIRVHELAWGFAQFRLLLVVSLVTLVAWLLRAGDYEGTPVGRSPRLLLLAVFLGFATLSAAFAVGTPDGASIALERAGKLGKIVLFLLLMQKMLDDFVKVRTFTFVWIVGTVFLALWGAQQHHLGNDRLDQVGGGDTNGSNELGALFVLILPIVLQLALIEEWRLRRWALFGIMPLLCVVIAFTGSRAAFLGFLVGGALLFLMTQQRKKLVKLALPLVPVIVVLSIAYFSQRVTTIQNYDQDWSAVSRLYFWRAAARMAAAHPAMGVGPANFPLCCAAFGSPEAGRDCHSTYFTMLAEVGIPGFLLWVTIVFGGARALDRLRKIEGENPERVQIRALAVGLEAGLLSFLFTGFFNSFGYYEYLYWPIVLAQCLTWFARTVPEEAPPPEPEDAPRAHALTGAGG
jgi:probable O-glycosylation ligase (exosortase A-associated)